MCKLPLKLQKGDQVAVVAPAGKVNEDALRYGLDVLNSFGLEVIIGKYVFADVDYFSASDDQRATDFQQALDNPEIKAVFCARGGYGSVRILPLLDWTNFKKNPKWIIGYSDITLLLSEIQQLGFACIHGPMPGSFDKYKKNETLNQLKNLLFKGAVEYELPATQLKMFHKKTSVEGILTGGNLSMIQTSIGTEFYLPTENKILFLEEVDEYPYRIDRMLQHLYHAGVFKNIKGLILGKFSMIPQENKFPFTLKEMLKPLLPSTLEFILYDFPAGHDMLNFPLVMGAPVHISVDKNKILVGQILV
jgi:muramoyltetrapeptide carboxypeptidase